MVAELWRCVCIVREKEILLRRIVFGFSKEKVWRDLMVGLVSSCGWWWVIEGEVVMGVCLLG